MHTTTLTPKLIEKLKDYIDRDDRTGYYLKYYEMTGCKTTLEMAMISQFSGFTGAVAEAANVLASDHPNYPKGGVIDFSKEIANKHFDIIKERTDKSLKLPAASEVYAIAESVWKDKSIGDLFPGHIKQAEHAMLERKAESAWNHFFTKGTALSAAGVAMEISSLGKVYGRTFADAIDPEHSIAITPDFAVRYVRDKEGKSIYVEETAARKVPGGFVVQGMTKSQVAEMFQVPENFVVDMETSQDAAAPTTLSEFLISTKGLNALRKEKMDEVFDVCMEQARESMKDLKKTLEKQKMVLREQYQKAYDEAAGVMIKDVQAQIDAQKAQLQYEANVECEARKAQLKATTPCNQHNGKVVGQTCTDTVAGKHCVTRLECDILVNCDDIVAAKQKMLDAFELKAQKKLDGMNEKKESFEKKLFQDAAGLDASYESQRDALSKQLVDDCVHKVDGTLTHWVSELLW